MKLFDIVSDLSHEKNNYLKNGNRDECLHEYNPFMINRAFSMHVDTVMYAAEMNGLWQLDKDMQHDYYFHALPRKKRFGWIKGDAKDVSIALVAKVYKVNERRARDILSLLTSDQIEAIQERSKYIV